jgi:subtilisin family serine protease
MKTRNTLKQSFMGALVLMFSFAFVSISLGQSDYFYYYRGSKIPMTLNTESINISTFKDFKKESLKNFDLAPFEMEADKSQKKASDLMYTRITFNSTISEIEYKRQLDEIKNIAHIRTVYPSFRGEDGTDIGLSDYLYVKLKSLGDYALLERQANQFDLEIVEQDEWMPLWYTLRCTETTPYTSLEVANLIFETGSFDGAQPDLLTFDDIECTNDPDFGSLWGLENTTDPNADVNACNAWTITKGAGANVAILDQGIEPTHGDLAGNLSPLSYDTESNSSPAQMFGDHGTHCAGTVGAIGDNNLQVVGIAPECTLFAISNSLAGSANSRQKRADGINWAVANGVDVISNSWRSGVQYQVIDDAIDDAFVNGRGGLGCVIVFAAGNGSGSPVDYPANYTDGILAVGSITSSGVRSGFSNIGAELDVVAPGSSILSTINNNTTGYKSGTSMATPHVAGLAGLIISIRPCLTYEEVNDIIEQSAYKNPSYTFSPTVGRPNGDWNNEMGYGLIDADAALQLAQTYSCNSCATTVSTFPYTESFESPLAPVNGIGSWIQNQSDDFDWTRDSGGTPSGSTGPSTAAEGSYYAYTESSSPNHPSKKAIIESPCFDLTGQNGLYVSFAYHMYGAAMGKLELQVTDDGGTTWNSLWGESSDQGDNWYYASASLSAYAGSTIQLRFAGETGNSFTSDMAIDDIVISDVVPCSATITSYPYTESFETDLGDWQQGIGDDFDWSRTSGGTPSSNTGPSSAADGSFYAYTEASYPNHPSKVAILNSPCFDLTGINSPAMSFQYHMFGATMGKLDLEVSTDNGQSWTGLWSEENDQGNQWLPATVDLSAYQGSVIQLRYVGTTSNGFTSDMAIDDISINSNPCVQAVSTFPYIESFETDFGLWTQDISEDFDWSRNSGSTPSTNTGPSAAHDGLWYAYTESSSPNHPNKSAHLLSPCIDLSNVQSSVMNFWYHMYGATMGTLAVEVSQDQGVTWNTLFVRTGDQGKAWLPASVNLSSYSGQVIQLRIVGKTLNGFTSDMAVDDMSINILKGLEKNAAGVLPTDETPDIIVYPNPASDHAIINLRSVDSDEYTVSILDMLGKEVYAADGENGIDLTIPTDLFESGTYMVVIRTNSGATFNRKLVVRN